MRYGYTLRIRVPANVCFGSDDFKTLFYYRAYILIAYILMQGASEVSWSETEGHRIRMPDRQQSVTLALFGSLEESSVFSSESEIDLAG